MLKLFIYPICIMLGVCVLFPSCSGREEPEDVKFLKVSDSSLNYSFAGGNEKVEISTNTQWSISDIPSWIMVSPNKGMGNATINIEVTPNSDFSPRVADIVIVGVNGVLPINTIVHVQQGLKDTIILEKTSGSIGYEGGTLEIPYQYTSTPSVSIEGNPEWIRISNETRALTDGKIIIVVEKNKGGSRSAKIRFQLGDSIEEYILTQEAYIPVQSISFSQSSPFLLTANGIYQLEALIFPTDSSDKALKWSSSNPDVAHVSDEGILTVISNGETIVKVTSVDSVSAEIEIIVKIKAESIAFVEWFDGNGWIQPGWSEITQISGSWGYEYTPQIQVIPENAFVNDLKFTSSNNMMVWVEGNKLVCSKTATGIAKITAESAYSNISASVMMEVRPCYLNAGLGHIEQGPSFFNMKFAGVLATRNSSDKFEIISVTILDESNQIVTSNFTATEGSNIVKWQTADFVNLWDYGIYHIDEDFYNKISLWKAVITYSNVNYQGTFTETINIDSHTQY